MDGDRSPGETGNANVTLERIASGFVTKPIRMSRVLIEHSPSPMKLEVIGVDDWPVVREAPGSYRKYCVNTETSYITRGAGDIRVADEPAIRFGAGDLVTVMPDTECAWNITEEIERHYSKG